MTLNQVVVSDFGIVTDVYFGVLRTTCLQGNCMRQHLTVFSKCFNFNNLNKMKNQIWFWFWLDQSWYFIVCFHSKKAKNNSCLLNEFLNSRQYRFLMEIFCKVVSFCSYLFVGILFLLQGNKTIISINLVFSSFKAPGSSWIMKIIERMSIHIERSSWFKNLTLRKIENYRIVVLFVQLI